MTIVLVIATPLFCLSMHFTEDMMEDTQERQEAATTSKERCQAHTRSKRRYKATNMAFDEMVEMVAILKKEDYDCLKGPYKNPKKVKAKIIENVQRTLHQKFKVQRSREQLRKRWSDFKRREPEQLERIQRVLRRRKLFKSVL